MNQYPPIFLERMRHQLGSSFSSFFEALKMPPVRGIRLNPRKPVTCAMIDGIGEKVPWNLDTGYYLSSSSKAGLHPLHECGAYYIQEPSAMAPVSILKPIPGEHVLDLCAAPGGKSTQIADCLQGEGLLVCNEPSPSRAKILSRNVERMGIPNSLVVSADPAALAKKWPEHFNAVLVDAPCSGEGMFRRHPETALEWNEESAVFCAQRQAHILDSAAELTCPGGRIVYSTCTHNTTEDDNTVIQFLERHPDWFAVPFEMPFSEGTLSAPQGMLHLYPNEIKGEGHFVALLQKKGHSDPSELYTLPCAGPSKPFENAFQDFCSQFGRIPQPNLFFGDTALFTPALPSLKDIQILRAGIQLGTLKGKIFSPYHALALALPIEADIRKLEISLEDSILYQHGDVLPCPEQLKGYVLPCLSGLPLGFGKAGNGQLKNHYPKGLRKSADPDLS